MSLDRLINILVTIMLVEMMVTLGLKVTFADILDTAKNWKLVLRAGLANYVYVPAVTVALLLLFQAQPMVAAGFLVLAVCPGSPFGPPFTAIAKGNVALSVGLMVVLAASSAVVSPLLLSALLPWLSGSDALRVDSVGMVGTLLITQLLPLLAGMLVKRFRPQLAACLQKPLERAGNIINLGVAGLILATQFQMLAQIRVRGFVGMFILLAASLGIGWLSGGGGAAGRKSMALTTSLRNLGVGLVIAASSFGGTPAVSAALAYGIVEIFGARLIAIWWGRRSRSTTGVGA